jgi:hypothetical protein
MKSENGAVEWDQEKRTDERCSGEMAQVENQVWRARWKSRRRNLGGIKQRWRRGFCREGVGRVMGWKQKALDVCGWEGDGIAGAAAARQRQR